MWLGMTLLAFRTYLLCQAHNETFKEINILGLSGDVILKSFVFAVDKKKKKQCEIRSADSSHEYFTHAPDPRLFIFLSFSRSLPQLPGERRGGDETAGRSTTCQDAAAVGPASGGHARDGQLQHGDAGGEGLLVRR